MSFCVKILYLDDRGGNENAVKKVLFVDDEMQKPFLRVGRCLGDGGGKGGSKVKGLSGSDCTALLFGPQFCSLAVSLLSPIDRRFVLSEFSRVVISTISIFSIYMLDFQVMAF